MAETIHLKLTANGKEIKGEATQHARGREDSIECVEFRDHTHSAREKGSRAAVGRRVHEAIEVVKRVDASSPLLAKALCNNEKVEGVFSFYRPSPAGDGEVEHFFTISIKDARIDAIKRHSPNVLDPAEADFAFLESVFFVFGDIEWVYEPKGIAHVDSWKDS